MEVHSGVTVSEVGETVTYRGPLLLHINLSCYPWAVMTFVMPGVHQSLL